MRLRTESSETAGRRPSSGIRMKLPRFWGGQRVQANVSYGSAIDGNQPLQEEEPPKGVFAACVAPKKKNIHVLANITTTTILNI